MTSGRFSSHRPPPTSRTRKVATTAGQKMPATHCGKVAAKPALDNAM
jgi:hypothetical protein